MDTLLTREEEQNQRRGRIISAVVHLLLLAIFLLPILTYPDPPPGQEGILVNLGADFGQGEENAPEPVAEEPQVQEERQEQEVQEEVQPREEKPVVEETPEREVVETEDPDAIALKKKKQQEAAEKKRQEEERLEEQRRQEEAERKKKEQEEAYNKAKDKFSGAFGGGDGEGKGNTGQPGNQGDKDGDPNADNLKGKSVGAGDVGGGLSDRGVNSQPKVNNPTQNTGTVVVEVCVDANGSVVSAKKTLRGSTTNNATLVKIAEDAARKWQFSKSSIDRQCGTISYTFKTQ